MGGRRWAVDLSRKPRGRDIKFQIGPLVVPCASADYVSGPVPPSTYRTIEPFVSIRGDSCLMYHPSIRRHEYSLILQNIFQYREDLIGSKYWRRFLVTNQKKKKIEVNRFDNSRILCEQLLWSKENYIDGKVDITNYKISLIKFFILFHIFQLNRN